MEHREACRRQHRVLGHFLAVQAWLRGLDCVVLDRTDLGTFLQLERFKSQRVGWLLEDLQPWFPHCKRYNKSKAPSSLQTLFLSRVEIEKFLPKGSMTTTDRIKGMAADAPKTERFFPPKKGYRALKEADIVRYLAILDSGLAAPEHLSSVPVAKP